MNKQRQCMYCGTLLSECFGYVLPRDILLVLEGKWDFETMGYPRELCERFDCNEKWLQELEQEMGIFPHMGEQVEP
jgi:hypothetical protein